MENDEKPRENLYVKPMEHDDKSSTDIYGEWINIVCNFKQLYDLSY